MRYEGLMNKIAAFIGDNPGCTGRDIAGHMDMLPTDLQPMYAKLQEVGKIRKEGARNQSRWYPGEVA